MQNDRLTRSKSSAAKTPTELLGYLQQMSRDNADGNTPRVIETAVALPIECIGADRSMLLRVPTDDGPCLPLACGHADWGLPAACHSSDACIVREAVRGQTTAVWDHLCSPMAPCTDMLCEDTACVACIPIIPSPSAPTVLICSRSSDVPFRVWEIELLNTIANLVAVALRDGTDHEHPVMLKAAHLERLQRITAHGRPLDHTLSELLPALIAMLEGDSGSVMLVQDRKRKIVSSVGLDVGTERDAASHRDGSVSSRAVLTRQPLLLHGPVSHRDFPGAAARPEITSAIVTPLISKRNVLGVLSINRTGLATEFNERDLILSRTVARFVALAIDNERLYETIRVQTRNYGSLYRIAKSVSSKLELNSLLKMTVKRLRALVDCDVCAVLVRGHSGQLELVSGYGLSDESEYEQLLSPGLHDLSQSRRILAIPDLSLHKSYGQSALVQALGLRSAVLTPMSAKQKDVGLIAAFSKQPRSFSGQDTGLLLGLSELAAIAIANARLYGEQSVVAKITQRELAPNLPSSMPGFQIGEKYAPAYRVGGDYYDLTRIDDRRYGLAIMDVAGKDIAASMHVAMCKYAFRALASCIMAPELLMREMNRFIYHQIDPDGFISMFYALIDTESGEMAYCSAGHEPALLLKAESLEVKQLRTPGILLGVKADATFVGHQSSIEAGDVLLLYTDGLLDSISEDHLDHTSVLEDMLVAAHMNHPQEIANSMHDAATRERSSRTPDDIAIVALKRAKKVTYSGK